MRVREGGYGGGGVLIYSIVRAPSTPAPLAAPVTPAATTKLSAVVANDYCCLRHFYTEKQGVT